MRKCLVVLLITLLCAAAGCSAEPKRVELLPHYGFVYQEGDLFINERFYYDMIVPQRIFKLVLPVADNSDGFVFEAREDEGVDMRFFANYWDYNATGVLNLADMVPDCDDPDVEILERHIRGDSAEALYRYKDETARYIVYIRDDTGYHAMLWAPHAIFDKYNAEFEKILKTWHVDWEAKGFRR